MKANTIRLIKKHSWYDDSTAQWNELKSIK